MFYPRLGGSGKYAARHPVDEISMKYKKFTRPPLVLALHLAGLASPVLAMDEDVFFSDLPVVASVSRLPQPLSEAPGAVTVIDREMIRASGARNFADLLRLVPAFQVTPPNQEGAIVAYHGLSNEEYTPRVQVLIDGRSQYSPLFKSGVNWNLLPVVLDNIDRIEVMRGPNAVAFGSNALLGVINIITLDASQTRGWMMAANHGNNSVRDETIRWGGKTGDTDLRLSYHQYGDGGFQKMQVGSAWIDPHDSRHGRVFDLRSDTQLTNRDELTFSFSFAEDISQYGRPNSTSDPFRDLNQHSTSASLEWRRNLAANEEVKLRLTHVEDWSAAGYIEAYSFDNVAGGKTAFNNYNNYGGSSRVDEIDFQHRFAPSAQTRAVWGMAGKWTEMQSPGLFSTSQQLYRQTYRLFGNLEWRPSAAWLANLGASVERDRVAGSFIDPRLGVSYHITPANTLRFVASRAHRTPSLYEAYGDVRKTDMTGAVTTFNRTYLGVPGLAAEHVDSFELGYLGEWKALRASLDVRAFHERIPNRIQIVPYPLPAARSDDEMSMLLRTDAINSAMYPYGRADSALNLERTTIQGYEYQARWQPFETTRLIYGHALITIHAESWDESVIADAVGNNITKITRQTTESAPRNSQSAMLIQRLPLGVDASLMYYKSEQMRWLRNSYTRPYERIDWRLAKGFNLGGTKVEVAYTAQMANHEMDGRRNTRVAKELHWLSARVEF